MYNRIILILFSLLLLLYSCSDTCDGENPNVRLLNNGSGKADIQIKTSGGNTENINNIEVGTFSEVRSFDPGEIEFTISIQGVGEPIEYFLTVDYCMEYIVKINADDTVNSTSFRLDYF